MGTRKYFWIEQKNERLKGSPPYAWECEYFAPIFMRVFPGMAPGDPLGILQVPATWSDNNGNYEREWCAYVYTTYSVTVAIGQKQLVHQPLGYCTELWTRKGAEGVATKIAKAYTEYWPMIRSAWSRGVHTEWREVKFGKRTGMQLLIDPGEEIHEVEEKYEGYAEDEGAEDLGNYLRDLVAKTTPKRDSPWT